MKQTLFIHSPLISPQPSTEENAIQNRAVRDFPRNDVIHQAAYGKRPEEVLEGFLQEYMKAYDAHITNLSNDTFDEILLDSASTTNYLIISNPKYNDADPTDSKAYWALITDHHLTDINLNTGLFNRHILCLTIFKLLALLKLDGSITLEVTALTEAHLDILSLCFQSKASCDTPSIGTQSLVYGQGKGLKHFVKFTGFKANTASIDIFNRLMYLSFPCDKFLPLEPLEEELETEAFGEAPVLKAKGSPNYALIFGLVAAGGALLLIVGFCLSHSVLIGIGCAATVAGASGFALSKLGWFESSSSHDAAEMQSFPRMC